MVTAFTGFSKTLVNFGFAEALIQKQDANQTDYSTIFWVNLIISIIIYGLIFSSANVIAEYYDRPQLVTFTKVIGIVYIIDALSIIPSLLLRKELRFKEIAIANICTFTLAGMITVYLAYTGYGVWSLIAQLLLNSFLFLFFITLHVCWFPSLTFSRLSIKGVFKFSRNLFGVNTLNYWANNIDNVIVGNFFGDGMLGIYKNAYSLIVSPLSSVNLVFHQVLFPSLSKVSDNKEQVVSIFRNVNHLILILGTFLFIVVFFTAPALVQTLLGEKWLETIPFVKIFSILFVLVPLNSVNSSLYLITEETGLLFRNSLITKATTIILFFLTAYFGIFYVACTVVVSPMIRLLLDYQFLLSRKVISFSTFFAILGNIVLPFSLSIWMILLADNFFTNPCIQLLLFPIITIIIYFMILYLQKDKVLMNILKTIKLK